MSESGLGTLLGMGLAAVVLWFAVGGLITGALARWLLPGPDPMSWLTTIAYGIGGSLLGGFAGRLLGVTVHDHVIIGREGHTSLRAKGLI